MWKNRTVVKCKLAASLQYIVAIFWDHAAIIWSLHCWAKKHKGCIKGKKIVFTEKRKIHTKISSWSTVTTQKFWKFTLRPKFSYFYAVSILIKYIFFFTFIRFFSQNKITAEYTNKRALTDGSTSIPNAWY